jgi:CheY-like chemotaxis protein
MYGTGRNPAGRVGTIHHIIVARSARPRDETPGIPETPGRLTMPTLIVDDCEVGAESPHSQFPDVRPLSVLVVDDYPDGAEALADLLEGRGLSAAAARTPVEAVLAAHRSPPDVVLIEVAARGFDGYALARRLRDGPGGPALVALTAQLGQEDLCRREGFACHFLMPTDPDVLRTALATLVRRDRRPDARSLVTEAPPAREPDAGATGLGRVGGGPPTVPERTDST